jgi:hypothetical protein
MLNRIQAVFPRPFLFRHSSRYTSHEDQDAATYRHWGAVTLLRIVEVSHHRLSVAGIPLSNQVNLVQNIANRWKLGFEVFKR